MLQNKAIPSLLAASALALAISGPAHAEGKGDRAQKEIAAAKAKIDTVKSMGAATEMPVGVAKAEETLKTAQEEASAGNKEAAIQDAIHAQAMADAASGEMKKRHDAAMADQQAAAQDQVAAAQNQAADANARASAAEQSAAQSAQAADAARQQAADAANKPPAQVETTVTTQQSSTHPASHVATRKVVTHKRVVHSAPETASNTTTTTTAVTQQ